MLQNGWKILDIYKRAYETDNLLAGGSISYYVFAHEDPNAQVPLTEREKSKSMEEIYEILRQQEEMYRRNTKGRH